MAFRAYLSLQDDITKNGMTFAKLIKMFELIPTFAGHVQNGMIWDGQNTIPVHPSLDYTPCQPNKTMFFEVFIPGAFAKSGNDQIRPYLLHFDEGDEAVIYSVFCIMNHMARKAA